MIHSSTEDAEEMHGQLMELAELGDVQTTIYDSLAVKVKEEKVKEGGSEAEVEHIMSQPERPEEEACELRHVDENNPFHNEDEVEDA